MPIATSPGRSGFGPHLSLSYDSNGGNGPFGFGWDLSLPAITRKTDKGLPRYRDMEYSDVFLLSGAEDLVPVYRQDPDGSWVVAHPGYQRDTDGSWIRDGSGNLIFHEDDIKIVHENDVEVFRVRRYRPRIEGLFARIERWTNLDDPHDVHWRSISKDNLLTIYGKDTRSRITDAEDPRRIFSWLICETRDDQGNAVIYDYKPDDGVGVDLAAAHERNRGDLNDPRRTTNRYISHNRFVTRYAYHHGYFDGEEREFRGFGMVEQWDTEEIGALLLGGEGEASNWDTAFQMPPVHTKTWFHTGAWLDRDHISRQFETEYDREPGLTDEEFRALLLSDTHLPDGLALDEEREACRALKGQMLRQEVYADDAGPDASKQAKQRARRPYRVVEQDFTIRLLQARAGNRHAVFFAHPREVIRPGCLCSNF